MSRFMREFETIVDLTACHNIWGEFDGMSQSLGGFDRAPQSLSGFDGVSRYIG